MRAARSSSAGRLDAPEVQAGPRRARGSASRTREPSRGATGSSSPTTGSTTAATRSCGTACGRRSRWSRPVTSATVETRVRAPIPPGPLPVRARHGRRGPRLVLRARERDAPAARSPSCRAGLPRRRTSPRGWSRRRTGASACAAAHAEGFGVVAGAIEWPRGLLRRRPHALDALPARARPRPALLPPAALPSAVDGDRARAAAGRGGAARVRRAAARAVGLRRADRPPRPARSPVISVPGRGAVELDGDPVVDPREHDRAPRASATTVATAR